MLAITVQRVLAMGFVDKINSINSLTDISRKALRLPMGLGCPQNQLGLFSLQRSAFDQQQVAKSILEERLLTIHIAFSSGGFNNTEWKGKFDVVISIFVWLTIVFSVEGWPCK